MLNRANIKHTLRTALLLLMSALLILNRPSTANASPGATAHPENTWGQFVIKSVHNISSTDMKSVHNASSTDPDSRLFPDSISLGATLLSKHGVDKINHTYLGYFWQGESKHYSDWVLAEVPLDDVSDFARVTLSLVEVDLGGRKQILTEIAEEENRIARENMLVTAQEKINEMVTQSLHAAGFESKSLEEDLIVLSAAIVFAVSIMVTISFVSTFWSGITSPLGDDAFALKYVEIPADHLPESGTVVFIDHGGEYRLDYEWRWVEKSVLSAAQADSTPASNYAPTHPFADLNEQIRKMWEGAQNQAASQTNKLFVPMIAN